MPCDVGACKFVPSPGDTGPTGCGLLPENEYAVWFYPKWKGFGALAFDIIDEDACPDSTESLMDKLIVIDQYSGQIAEANEKRRNRTPSKKKKGK